MKFILISPKNRTAYNFRGDLIKEIIGCGYEVVVTGPNRENMEHIEALGARFAEIPMDKNGVNPVADLRYLMRLIKLFRKEKPDVTLGYTVKPVVYGAIAAKVAGVKTRVSMVTGAGYAFTAKTGKAKIIRAFVKFLYKIGFSCADRVVFQNEDDRDMFVREQRLLKEEKCALVNGSGVNTERFRTLPFPEKTTFFMLSRVMYSKGIREYLEAARQVKSQYPDVVFMLLGAVENIQDSLKQEELDEYIRDGIIEYYGETSDVTPYYGMCSVYVLPSYREGTPRTVLEAMATGRPVITTDAPGCRGTVIDGETGFLVEVKNADDLAQKMMRFIENPELIVPMGEKGRKYCLEKYDVKKVNAVMRDYLNIR